MYVSVSWHCILFLLFLFLFLLLLLFLVVVVVVVVFLILFSAAGAFSFLKGIQAGPASYFFTLVLGNVCLLCINLKQRK